MSEHFPQDDDYRGQIDLKLWRRIATHARPYRRQLIGLGVAGLIVAMVDALFPLLTGLLIDEAIARGMTPTVYIYIAAYAGLGVVMAACVAVFILFAGQTATGIAYDLRTRGFARLQDLQFSYYDTRPVGWLVTRLTSDCSKVSSLIPWFMLDLVWGSCTLLAIAAVMLWLDWQLGLAVLAIVPPLAIVSALFQRKLLYSSRQMRKTNSQMTASFNEAISGVRTTKAFVREQDNLREFQTLSTSMFDWSMRNALQSAVYLPVVIAMSSLGVGLALWYGGVKITYGELTFGTIVAFMQYAALFSMPIQELARRFTDLQAAQAAAERIQSLLDTEPEIQDLPEVRERIAARAAADAVDDLAEDGLPARIETLEFRNVSFWYKPDEPVLEDLNLTIRAGQSVALVGPTGGGKSTIVNLAARFYEPTDGEILINGTDYRQRGLHWLQSQLGIVLQSPVLFSGSVLENIRYGRLNATDAEIERAARIVNAHTFITAMEDGYQTDIGEGGSRLSTGQRQLLSLARAVLADPQIFIMDEATSSVDTQTERLIQDAIDEVMRGRMSFVIAHRLSTIRAADVILVIDGGRIVEQGNHASLIRQRGRYYQLYARQFSHEREERVLSGGA